MENLPTYGTNERKAVEQLREIEHSSLPTREALRSLSTPLQVRPGLKQQMNHYVDLAEAAIKSFDPAAQQWIIEEAEKVQNS